MRNINPGYAQISYGTSDKLYNIILFNGSITIILIIIGNKKVVERVKTNLLLQSQYLLLINEPVSKEDILSNVWKHQRKLETHTLESLVYRLRLKIEKDPKNPKILKLKGKKYFINMLY